MHGFTCRRDVLAGPRQNSLPMNPKAFTYVRLTCSRLCKFRTAII